LGNVKKGIEGGEVLAEGKEKEADEVVSGGGFRCCELMGRENLERTAGGPQKKRTI